MILSILNTASNTIILNLKIQQLYVIEKVKVSFFYYN
jgi:hypothetical protein